MTQTSQKGQTTIRPGLVIRRANQRGRTQIDWLDSFHSFSFGEYFDPQNMGFRALRVINDDRIAPGGGFGEHGHRDMEIFTWVLDGALRHRDSLGHEAPLRPGEVQAMTAGRGIRHSEFNDSEREPVRLLQIWLEPESKGLAPAYAQKEFPAGGRQNRLQLIVSHDGRDGSVPIHQDASVYVANLSAGQSVTQTFAPGRHGWVQVALGSVMIDGHTLNEGDAATISGLPSVTIQGNGDAQVLVFDLA